MSDNFKTVAIIGAGPSGLVSGKECLANNLKPYIYELNHQIGGIWSKSVWSSMRTNITKFTTVFSDFEWDQTAPIYPHSNQVLEYLKQYACINGLYDYIHLNRQVISIKKKKNKDDTESWLVSSICLKTKTIDDKSFDFVIVASGVFSKPHVPKELDGILDNFTGIVVHSGDYKSKDERFKGKNVLVIGASYSAAEIASDLVEQSSSVINIINRPYWFIPRYLKQTKDDITQYCPADYIFYKFKEFIKDKNIVDSNAEKINAGKNFYFSTIVDPVQNEDNSVIYMDKTSKEPLRVVISDSYVNNLKSGKINVKKDKISRIENRTVHLSDETSINDIDVIILATGYELNLDYLEKEISDLIEYDMNDQLQPIILFNCTFHPQIKNLAFVGVYRGPFFAVMELQARWVTQVFSGKISLPSNEIIKNGIDLEKKIRNEKPRPQFPHGDYMEFAKSLAKLINAMPDLDEIQMNDQSLFECLNDDMIMLPAVFRLKDKNSKASESIKNAYFQLKLHLNEINKN